MKANLGILIAAIGFLTSCGYRIYPAQVRPYILNQANGLTVWDTFGNLRVTCIYFPNEYAAAEEAAQSGVNYKKTLNDMSNTQFFELRLSDSSGTQEFLRVDNNPAHYQERLNYLLTGIQNDITLIDGSDTLRKPETIAERTFGVTPYNTILLTFPNPNKKRLADKTLIINDPVAGGQPLTFTINQKNISKIPPIKKITKPHDISAQ